MGSAGRGDFRGGAPRLTLSYHRLAWVLALGTKVEKGMRRNLEAQPLRLGADGGGWLVGAGFPHVCGG